MAFQPLNDKFKIVNPDGTPNQYFIRLFQQRGIQLDNSITVEEAQALIDAWALDRDIIAGDGLSGGGNLSSDVTIDLDATLNDLNDVDTTGVVDGNALVYDASLGMWVPGAGGGGGSGNRIWGVINSVTGAVLTGSGNFTYTRLSNDQGNVIFNTPLPDANYGVLFGGTDQGVNFGSFPMVGNVARTASTFRVFIAYNTSAVGNSTAFTFEVVHPSLGGGGGGSGDVAYQQMWSAISLGF